MTKRNRKPEDDDLLNRMVRVGCGVVSADLAALRKGWLEHSKAMVDVLCPGDTLRTPFHKVDARLALEDYCKTHLTGTFNSAYCQKIQKSVIGAIGTQRKQYFQRLTGWLAHIDEPLPRPDKVTGRRFVYVPLWLQDVISNQELQGLKEAGQREGIGLFRRVLIKCDFGGLSRLQCWLIWHLHAEIESRFKKPVFGKDADFVCQIHIDARVLSSGAKHVIPAMNAECADLLFVKGASGKPHEVLLSNPAPRSAAIKVPAKINQKAIAGLGVDGKTTRLKGFVLEIGKTRFDVKVVAQKTHPYKVKDPLLERATEQMTGSKEVTLEFCQAVATQMNRCKYLVCRDFGYTNTIAMSVVLRDKEILADDLLQIFSHNKVTSETAKTFMYQWFTQGEHASQKIVEEVLYDGKDFLARINAYCTKIEQITSEVDCLYNKVRHYKRALNNHLGQELTTDIPLQIDVSDSYIKHLHSRMFKALTSIRRLKKCRRRYYAKIDAIKSNWFGWLSSRERDLAQKYQAAVVRENLTIMPIEKAGPQYKGRVVNPPPVKTGGF